MHLLQNNGNTQLQNHEDTASYIDSCNEKLLANSEQPLVPRAKCLFITG